MRYEVTDWQLLIITGLLTLSLAAAPIALWFDFIFKECVRLK